MKPQPRYKKGERIANRYLVHQALMGGMGEVYLCLDLEQNYPYALKTFQQRYLTDAQRLRRAFEQEVATWVALEQHPNIVRCFYMRALDNQPFMLLEWIAGEEGRGTDLRSWLHHGPLDLKLTLQIAIDLCYGLLYAQEKRPGLVHRDLKPENILIAQGGLAKITDFGLAQIVQTTGLTLANSSVTSDGRRSMIGGKGIVGTPAYMAPEQWRGEPLDQRTDIYALGCIFYELLTGSAPFTVDFAPTTPQQMRNWLAAMQRAHEQIPVAPLSGVLPAELNHLVQRCLAKASAERYPTLAELLTGLRTLYQAHFAQSPPTRPAPDAFTAGDYNNRGNTYADLQDHAAALADFTHSLELDPTFATAYNNRGLIYAALQDYAAALLDYTRALELDPAFAQAYTNRGLTYTALGQQAAALADYTQALILDPTLATAYFNRGVTYVDLGQYAAALADYTRALSLNQTFAIAYYNRGVTYAALGQQAAALADYTQALILDPTDAEIYTNRGVTYAALGQQAAALADFTHALTLNPNHAIAHLNMGIMLYQQNNFADALPYFEQAAHLGEPQGAELAALARQMAEQAAEPPLDPEEQAWLAFAEADTPAAMQQAVIDFPLLAQAAFIETIEQAFAQRLTWLRQIANTQQPRSTP